MILEYLPKWCTSWTPVPWQRSMSGQILISKTSSTSIPHHDLKYQHNSLITALQSFKVPPFQSPLRLTASQTLLRELELSSQVSLHSVSATSSPLGPSTPTLDHRSHRPSIAGCVAVVAAQHGHHRTISAAQHRSRPVLYLTRCQWRCCATQEEV